MEIMRERARRLNGRLTVTPRDGGGTVVEVSVSTAEPPADADPAAGEGGVHAHNRPAH